MRERIEQAFRTEGLLMSDEALKWTEPLGDPGMGIDPLDLLALTMELEREFTIDIPDEHAEQWRTPEDIATYLAPRTVNP